MEGQMFTVLSKEMIYKWIRDDVLWRRITLKRIKRKKKF